MKIAEIVPQKLEEAAFEILKPTFWVRYVGDNFVSKIPYSVKGNEKTVVQC